MDESRNTSSANECAERLAVLFDKLVDQSLSPAEFQELEQLLLQSESLRLLYAEQMSLEIGITGWRTDCDAGELLDALAKVPVGPCIEEKPEPVNRRRESAQVFFSGEVARPWVYGLVAAVSLGIVAAYQGWWNFEEPGIPRIASASVPSGAGNAITSDSRDMYIGRVRSLSDSVVWKNGDFLDDFLLRIEPGEELSLEQGLAEIELKSGVTLTLHGNTSYSFSTGEHGVLNHGTISAHTNRGGYTMKFGKIVVRSLGDEASFAVVSNGINKVAVSQGEVSVVNEKKKRTTAPVLLGSGKVVYVTAAGKLTGTNDRPAPSHNQRSLAGNSYRPPQGLLSIADVVIGGNGLGANLAGMMDAASGKLAWRDMQDEPLLRLPGGQFIRGQSSLLIDGTLVASPGAGRLQVSSAGHIASGVKASGGSRGIIWARRPLRSEQLNQTRFAMMDNSQFTVVTERLKRAIDGVVGMSVNTGITFDLAKANKMQGSPIIAFEALGRILESEGVGNSLDLMVIVDGEVRKITVLSGQDEEDHKVCVSLSPADRYLTLFVAGEANGSSLDQAVLFDPMLVLGNAEQQP